MENRIHKYFFMKPAGSFRAFCSHCGHMVMQDHYQLKKHAEENGILAQTVLEIMDENTYVYALDKEDHQTLKLVIAVPEMHKYRRNPSLYENGSFRSIYQALFRWNTREVKEEGMYDLNTWLYLIEKKRVRYMGDDPAAEVIADVFPVVPDIISLTMFAEIYRTKGYKIVPHEISAEEQKHLVPKTKEKAAAYGKDQLFGELLKAKDGSMLAIRYYAAGCGKTGGFFSFLIKDGFLHMCGDYKGMNFRKIWTFCYDSHIPYEVLINFDQQYPSFGLRNYLEHGGRNLLLPLLCSGNYHKGAELLIKGGYAGFGDRYFSEYSMKSSAMFDEEPWPMDYRNAADLLGLPKGLLRNIPAELMMQENIRKRIAYVYASERRLLEGLSFNEGTVNFLMNQDVLHDHSVQRSSIPGLSSLDVRQTRRILEYISKRSIDDYQLYIDYLQMKYRTGINDFGYCPHDLETAHDDLVRSYRITNELSAEQKFREAVIKYREHSSKKDEAGNWQGTYFIRAPKNIADLASEGRAMHNCVASYEHAIMEGRTEIYFMRRTADPDVSLVTIEVRNGNLIQAKAFANKRCSISLQMHICRWCRENKFDYESCRDISPEVIERMKEE